VDREYRKTLEETAEARRGYQQFKETVGPFEAMIRAEGGHPLQAVGNLLNTAAALRTAPVAHKGQVIASLINTFGIPLEAVNAALGGPQTGQPSSTQPQMAPEYRDPRVDELLSTLREQRTQHLQAIQQKSTADVEAFLASKEFAEDVREEMADLMDVVSMQNQRRLQQGLAPTPFTLDDAYNRAVQLKPDIVEVLKQREAAKAAQSSQSSTQRARYAASSVRSQPLSANGRPTHELSLREEIERAAQQQER
jgi:hypothetical protein